MQVQVDAEAAELENQITYLYNFRAGRSISSFGTVYDDLVHPLWPIC